MRATVVKRISFDAAHYLPYYQGKCYNMHGHHWVVEVGVSGEVHPDTGMVVDFKWLKEATMPIVDRFDHGLVNDTLVNPTAENIAEYILHSLDARWKPPYGCKLAFVRVWETEDSYAEVRCE